VDKRFIMDSTGSGEGMDSKVCQLLIMQFIVAGKDKTTKRAGKMMLMMREQVVGHDIQPSSGEIWHKIDSHTGVIVVAGVAGMTYPLSDNCRALGPL